MIVRDDMAGSPSVRFITGAELRASAPAEPDPLVGHLIVANAVTMFAGKPKAGKSTLKAAIAHAVAGPATRFLGQQLAKGPVLYASEENAATLAHKVGAGDVYYLPRDLVWPKPTWTELIEGIAQEKLRTGAVLAVIDTLSFWGALPAEREKDSGAIQALMEPVFRLTAGGLAVDIVTHTRKGGGQDGEGIRGSGAIAGSADIIVEMDRGSAPRQRVLQCLSRYPSTPGSLVIEHNPADGGWALIGEGEHSDPRAVSDRLTIIKALDGADSLTRQELEAAVGAPERQWHNVLEDLVSERLIARVGAGRKGDPYRFQMLRSDSARATAQNVRTNVVNGADFSAAHPVRDAAEQSTVAANPNTARRAANDYIQDGIKEIATAADEAEAERMWSELEATLEAGVAE